MTGFDSRGKPSYTTRYRLSIENRGEATADQLTFSLEVGEADSGEAPMILGDVSATRLPAGGLLDYPVVMSLGTAQQCEIRFNWKEDGTNYGDLQTLRF